MHLQAMKAGVKGMESKVVKKISTGSNQVLTPNACMERSRYSFSPGCICSKQQRKHWTNACMERSRYSYSFSPGCICSKQQRKHYCITEI